MGPDRWHRITRVYHAALARQPFEREAFVREACADDDEVRREVESLLRQPASAQRLFDTRIDATVTLTGLPRTDPGLRQLSGYRLLSLLGTGAMGEVFRARDLKLGRDVAVKILPELFATDADRLSRF